MPGGAATAIKSPSAEMPQRQKYDAVAISIRHITILAIRLMSAAYTTLH